MRQKFMRGYVHIIAIILGIAAPSLLTFGTLRKGAKYEITVTPKALVADFLKDASGNNDKSAAIAKYATADVVIHKNSDEKGANALGQAIFDSPILQNTFDPKAQNILAAGDIIVVRSATARSEGGSPIRVDAYRVFGGKIVEYWNLTPKS